MSTLTAFYDLAHGPVSYDFITWLVRARMIANVAKCPLLHVVLVPNEGGLGGFSRHWGPHDEAATRWRLWHICMPAVQFVGATVTLADSRAQADRLEIGITWRSEGKAHLARHLVEAAKKGLQIPLLSASGAARRYIADWLGSETQPVVTLTLRRQDNDTARNSDLDAHKQMADWLRARGCAVHVLGDSHIALQNGRGYAELDIDLRLALYERAAMNIVGNNGPAALLWHSAAPYLRMGAGTVADWSSNLGLAQGEQVPWARAGQRCVYAPDSFSAMREAFEAWAGETN